MNGGDMKCFSCENVMEQITAYHGQGYCDFILSDSEPCLLYVCTCRDCKDVGIVRCIPSEPKEG